MTRESLLAIQPVWARKLVQHTYFEAIDNVLEPISKKELSYIVSDGSAKAKHMTFGWIITTTKGQQFASGQGNCAGRPSSLCGEASGNCSTYLRSHKMNAYVTINIPLTS